VQLTRFGQVFSYLSCRPVHQSTVLQSCSQFVGCVLREIFNHNCVARSEPWVHNSIGWTLWLFATLSWLLYTHSERGLGNPAGELLDSLFTHPLHLLQDLIAEAFEREISFAIGMQARKECFLELIKRADCADASQRQPADVLDFSCTSVALSRQKDAIQPPQSGIPASGSCLDPGLLPFGFDTSGRAVILLPACRPECVQRLAKA